jgi:cardiolipin synthase
MPRKKKQKISSQYMENNEVKFIRGGKEYFTLMLKLIKEAKDTIHLQTYIFDNDETGTSISDALKEAAARKVKVYFIVDGYASQKLSKEFIKDIKKAGVHFRFFEPLFRSKHFYFGRRLHQKLFVVDNSFALVGGVNITNRYNDRPECPAWLDFGVCVEGEIVKQLCIQCWKTWKGFPSKMGLTPCEKNPVDFKIPHNKSSLVRLRRNDWVRAKTQISQSYVEMLRTSESHIIILSSYFLPGILIRKHLIRAVQRGVKIKLVLAGLSDVAVAKSAERFIYSWLLRNKIKIYEYQGNMLHGKLSVADSKWMTIGSYNINNISAYASVELNLDINNPLFAQHVEGILDEVIDENCKEITTANFKKSTNIFKRLIRWCSYEFVRAALYLFTFYFRQRA